MIEPGDSELDLILRDLFPKAGSKPKPRTAPPRGRLVPPGAHLPPYHGESIGPEVPAPDAGPQDPIGRLVEFLRNNLIHAEPPAHQAPIDPAEQIDIFPTAAVSIPGGGYGGGSFTTVITYNVPDNLQAVFTMAGQAAESAAAYQDIQWRIRIDQKAHKNYSNIRLQLFRLAPPGTVIYIPVSGGQTIDIQAASLSATTYNVWARLMGWQWPTKYLEGESALGNLVG